MSKARACIQSSGCVIMLLACGCAAPHAREMPDARLAPEAHATSAPREPAEARYAQERAVVLSRGAPEEAETLLTEANRTLAEVERLLQLSTSEAVVTVRLGDSRSAMRAYLKEACPDQADSPAACFYTAGGCVIALYRQSDAQAMLRQVRHEAAHFAVMERFQEIPPWIHEGLASCFEGGAGCEPPSRAALERLRDDAAEGDEGALADLVDLPAGAPLDLKGYARAWSLTHFLLTQLEDGPAAVRSYLERVQAGQHAAEQFADAFGVSPAELAPAWRLYLVRLMAPEKNDE